MGCIKEQKLTPNTDIKKTADVRTLYFLGSLVGLPEKDRSLLCVETVIREVQKHSIKTLRLKTRTHRIMKNKPFQIRSENVCPF